nr:MAG TPA: hypothetical protein [Caudoviricetes sp.]DAP85064.1 MAG TPA: hypothetical protein [Caudoviricetes sp.]DAV88956.1 MAG TPA: hypothetical protein [Caudoviricetes sp.]DAY43893.1 MAG TPA: hypothetical protein [Caudoviricetes sp.]
MFANVNILANSSWDTFPVRLLYINFLFLKMLL